MLVTTCPECETTFRVTAGILDQAGGQVRCGRCSHIFDANTALREHPDAETRPIGKPEADTEAEPPVATSTGWFLTDAPPFDEFTGPPPIDEPDVTENPLAIPADETGTDADPAETAAAAPDDAVTGDAVTGGAVTGGAVTGGAVTGGAVTGGAVTAPEAAGAAPDWLPPPVPAGPRPRWPYAVAAAVLVLALGVQSVHRFRAGLAEIPAIAGPLQGLYAALGLEPPVNVDLDRYELLDLTAVAEPVTAEQGWLVIETRVQNTGPGVQPVPHIFVALLDRWQETIAGRYFGPEEYAVGEAGNVSRLPSGGTIDAQFVIVDPGPAATGFELQICVPAGRRFVCEGDEIFE